MSIQKYKAKRLIIPTVLAVLISGVVLAKPSVENRDGHMVEKFEHMLKHLDLNDTQQSQANLILRDLKNSLPAKQGKKGSVHSLMALNPEDKDYLEKVNAQADLMSAHLKAKVLELAKAKKSLYAILDEEQKKILSKKIERRMNKLEKHRKH